MEKSGARILVLSTSEGDGALLRSLLRDDCQHLEVCTKPERFPLELERSQPQILILAFESLEEAERCYLGLYRSANMANAVAHRSIVLCSKDDVQRAYAQCCKNYFDDYVLFWPQTHDAPRLKMAIRTALCALNRHEAAASQSVLAALRRRIIELEALVAQQVAIGHLHTEAAEASVRKARSEVSEAISSFSNRILENGLDEALTVCDAPRVELEFDRLAADVIHPSLESAASTMVPVREWMHGLRVELEEPIHQIRLRTEQSKTARPLLLVVDDDSFVRKLLSQVLSTANYDVECVATGAEALSLLRTRRPDLILMDVMLPDIDGIEVTRRLKSVEAFSKIPVIMLTGQSKRQIFTDSLSAGAADFVVKPFDRQILLKKVDRYLLQ